MRAKTKVVISAIACVLLIVFFLWVTRVISFSTGYSIKNSKDDFAKCLAEKGVKMYGAYWCSHCNNQKEMFWDSFRYINYIECDANGENANPSACIVAGIQGYPTWIINGKRYEGEKSFEDLSKLSGCKL